MPTSTAISPTAKVRLPHQSIFEGERTPRSSSIRYAHTVPRIPIGTDTRNTKRQANGASTPPSTRPMNDPAIAATMLMPSASPRSLAPKASVRMAEELANKNAAPIPCTIRMTIIHRAPADPCSQVTDSKMQPTVNMAKPRLYIRTRPNMSPTRPRLTTSTAPTTRKPSSIHSR